MKAAGGARARQLGTRRLSEADVARRTREILTAELRGNLTHVDWAWSQQAQVPQPVSLPTQVIATFLSLLVLTPLETLTEDLRRTRSPDRWKQLRLPDLIPGSPGGLLTHLAEWRAAIGMGRVEVLRPHGSRRVLGLRATLPGGPGEPEWGMELDMARLCALVEVLTGKPPLSALGEEPPMLTPRSPG